MHELLDQGRDEEQQHAGAEYRAQFVYINPIALNSETTRRVSWIEHRLRLDAAVDYKDKVKIVTSADVLDGVLWGDNGDYGGDPSPISGSNVNAKNPNVTRACVGQIGGDPLEASSYGYTLSNYLTGDTGDNVTGTLTSTSPYTPGSGGTFALNYASGKLTSLFGYGFTYANNASGIIAAAPPVVTPSTPTTTASTLPPQVLRAFNVDPYIPAVMFISTQPNNNTAKNDVEHSDEHIDMPFSTQRKQGSNAGDVNITFSQALQRKLHWRNKI